MTYQPIEPFQRQNLLTLAESYVAGIRKLGGKIEMSSLARKSHGNPPFFDQLKAGECGFTARKYDETMAWFMDDANWPPGIPRPPVWIPEQPVAETGRARRRARRT